MLFRLALIPLVGAMIGLSVAAPTEYTQALVVRRVCPHHRHSAHQLYQARKHNKAANATAAAGAATNGTAAAAAVCSTV